MNRRSLCVVLAAALCFVLANQAHAQPGSTYTVNTVNYSGGANLIGAPITFSATGLNYGVVFVGSYSFGTLNNAGTYYYFPLSNYTVFTGTYRGAPLNPGGSVFTSGQIQFNSAYGSAVVRAQEQLTAIISSKRRSSCNTPLIRSRKT